MNNDLYQNGLVTYLDILGFQDIIDASKTDAAVVAKILTVLTTVKNEFAQRVWTEKARRTGVSDFFSTNFSDLTVRCTRMPDPPSRVDVFTREVVFIAEKQFTLVTSEVLLRGGLCEGQIWFDKARGLVFGPSLVQAYKIESEYALFPRVAIDRDLVRSFDSTNEIRRDYLTRGDDGVFFIDYLFGTFIDAYALKMDEEDPFALLSQHRCAAERLILAHKSNRSSHIRQKYLWLGLYHNDAIRRLRDRFKSAPARRKKIEEHFLPESLLDF